MRRRGLFFRLEEGRLVKGDTVTITYGDTRGGSPGFRVQTFSNDAFPLPIYVNPRGNRELITWPIQTYTVRGGKVNGVHGFAPSVVKTGEAFTLSVRSEDSYYNREHEIRNVRVASKAGLAPKLLHVVDGVQVSEFVSGKSLRQGEPVQDATIIAVAELLRSMHELSLPDDYHSYDMVRIARRQLGELQPGTLGDTDLRKLHAVLDRAPPQIPQGLIHADLLPENFIDDGERHWLVDWEYGGRGDPVLGLANLSAGFLLNEEQEEFLLEAYGACDRKKVKAFGPLNQVREAVWCLTQIQNAGLHGDLGDYTQLCLSRLGISSWCGP